jgi:hypothetical protein
VAPQFDVGVPCCALSHATDIDNATPKNRLFSQRLAQRKRRRGDSLSIVLRAHDEITVEATQREQDVRLVSLAVNNHSHAGAAFERRSTARSAARTKLAYSLSSNGRC